ncbi:MAG: hypothetical protein EGQ63_08800, partial [Clostridiales bacterium]|nr:hypothetical protein [Clostridiales bacterium]
MRKRMSTFMYKHGAKLCNLALAMVGTAIPVTANASTVNNAGTYTTASMTRTASGSGTVTGTAKGSNNTNASKYVD